MLLGIADSVYFEARNYAVRIIIEVRVSYKALIAVGVRVHKLFCTR
jgi:hypothetical protein